MDMTGDGDHDGGMDMDMDMGMVMTFGSWSDYQVFSHIVNKFLITIIFSSNFSSTFGTFRPRFSLHLHGYL